MRHRVAGIVAVAVVLLVGGTTAVAARVTDDDGPWWGRGDGMMSSQRHDRADGWDRESPGGHATGGMFGGLHAMQAGSEDVYLAEMVAHHEEAVAAAQQLQRSPRAEMREFGDAIVASQSAQIDLMQQWLADWYPDRAGRVDYEPMMRDLTGLSGARLDRVFLQDMIWHHMAAVMTSQQLLVRDVAEHDAVEQLAESIRDEQHAEILQMQRWLGEWFGEGWQHGMRAGRWDGMHAMGGPWMDG